MIFRSLITRDVVAEVPGAGANAVPPQKALGIKPVRRFLAPSMEDPNQGIRPKISGTGRIAVPLEWDDGPAATPPTVAISMDTDDEVSGSEDEATEGTVPIRIEDEMPTVSSHSIDIYSYPC